ncbi:hypothetical protein ABT299_49110 [Spirillospora sp. NPDC000708]
MKEERVVEVFRGRLLSESWSEVEPTDPWTTNRIEVYEVRDDGSVVQH